MRAGFIQPSESPQEVLDEPPPYEEVIKTEAPPPAYYTVVTEAYKHVPSPVSHSLSTYSLPTASPPGTSSSSEKPKGPKAALSSSCIPVHKASGRVSSAASGATRPQSDFLGTRSGRRAASQSPENMNNNTSPAAEHPDRSTGNRNAPRQPAAELSSGADPIRTAIVRALDSQSTGTRQTSQRHLCQTSQVPAPTHRPSGPETRA